MIIQVGSKRRILNIVLLIYFLAISTNSYSQTEIINKLIDNSFKIECYKDSRISKTGSGFILFENKPRSTVDGKQYICISNEHVFDNIDSAVILFSSGIIIPIKGLVATIHKLDACFFIISEHKIFTGLINKESLGLIINQQSEIGSNIRTVSSPKGLLNTYSVGNISAFRKSDYKELIQITAPISHGSSGGVLADNNGLPIGLIVSQYSEGQNLNFCISLSQIFKELRLQKLLSDDLIFNDSGLVKVDKLESLITNSDETIKELYKLRGEDSTKFNIQLDQTNNDFLTGSLLFIKAWNQINSKDLNESLETILCIYKKYSGIVSYYLLANWAIIFDENFNLNEITKSNYEYLKQNESNDAFLQSFNLYLKGITFFNKKNYSETIYNLKELLNLYDKDNSLNLRDPESSGLVYLTVNSRQLLLNKLAFSCWAINDLANAENYFYQALTRAIAENQISNNQTLAVKYFAKLYVKLSLINKNSNQRTCYIYKKYLKNIDIDWDQYQVDFFNDICN